MYNRDFLSLHIGNENLIITCDSIGAIGPKEHDVVKADPYIVGRFLARVALMELLSVGATLDAISCTFSVEPRLAEKILEGIFAETLLAHPNPRSIVTISTEKNIIVSQTGAGITCIGRTKANMIRNALSLAGDIVASLGTSKMGNEVYLDDPEIADINNLLRLLEIDGVKDIIPVGSRGILHECKTLANVSGLHFEIDSPDVELLSKSAGPATSMVFSCAPPAFEIVQKEISSVKFLGILNQKENFS